MADKLVKCKVTVLTLTISIIDGKETSAAVKDGVMIAPPEDVTYHEGDVFDCPESRALKLKRDGSAIILGDIGTAQPSAQASQSNTTTKSTVLPPESKK